MVSGETTLSIYSVSERSNTIWIVIVQSQSYNSIESDIPELKSDDEVELDMKPQTWLVHSLLQIMYLYYILGWRLTRKYFKKFEQGGDESELREKMMVNSTNYYLLEF